MDVSKEWRDRIEYCSKPKPPVTFARAIPTLREPSGEQAVQIECTELLKDEAKRTWAFVWAPGFEHPTSFRLSPEDPDRYDLRVSSNKAVTNPGAPKPLPEWCRASVQEERKAR